MLIPREWDLSEVVRVEITDKYLVGWISHGLIKIL
jgi:hypothetical protein